MILHKLKNLPTQLYMTLPSPDHETYLRTCAPRTDEWPNLLKSLKLFPRLKTRKVIRLTLVKDLNMKLPQEYAKLIEIAKPDWVEVKAFMSVGGARSRLPYELMPLHSEIKNFAKEIGKVIGYKLLKEKK